MVMARIFREYRIPYSTFQNRNRRGQCKVLLPLIKKLHLEKTQKRISSHCLTNLCMFNETKESKN